MPHSQTGEHLIIERILGQMGRLKDPPPTFIDIGAYDGVEMSNTRDLVEKYGASGLLIDADGRGNPEVVQALVTVENAADLVRGREDVDFLSIDIDGNDYWILEAILRSGCRPKLVCAEVNTHFRGEDERFSVPYDPSFRWAVDNYYGMSYGAAKALLERFGYRMAAYNQLNAFAVREDCYRPEMGGPPVYRKKDYFGPPPVLRKWHRVE